MKQILLLAVIALGSLSLKAQNTFPSSGKVGIGTTTPNASSLLEVKSTTKGILIPRMTQSQRNAIATPATGLMIYQTGNYPDFYFYDGSSWLNVGYWQKNASSISYNQGNVGIGSIAPNYKLNVNGDINIDSNGVLRIEGLQILKYDSTHNNLSLGSNAGSSGNLNTVFGTKSLFSNTSGYSNTIMGFQAGYSNTSGYSNVAMGTRALYNNRVGSEFVAIGDSALYNCINNSENIGIGSKTLYKNIQGYENVAIGYETLYSNRSSENTGIGFEALLNNTDGGANVATGVYALFSNTTGGGNVAIGVDALYLNTTGSGNVAVGGETLHDNSTGGNNSAFGGNALNTNTTGSSNVANGYYSLGYDYTGSDNTAIGYESEMYLNSGNSNVAVGTHALWINSAGSNLVAVGDSALYNQTVNSNGYYSNTATGSKALYSNNTGAFQTANGYHALYANTTGLGNTALGNQSLSNSSTGNYNTGLGMSSLQNDSAGSNNTGVGAYANISKSNLSNATALGYGAVATASNQVMLGNTSVTNVMAAGSYTIYSDGRYKKNIKANVPGLEFINQLTPVTYTYDIHGLNNKIHPSVNSKTTNSTADKIAVAKNTDADEKAIDAKEKKVFTGLIAQDVEKAAEKLNYDFSGLYKPQGDKDVYGLSYSDFVMPLIKSVQDLSKMNDTKDSIINNLEIRLSKIEAMLASNQAVTGSQQSALVSSASLAQNIPNPFSSATTIGYNLPAAYSSANIIVTDAKGVVLKQISLNAKGKGNVQLDASTLASGAYRYSLYVDGRMVDSKQMISSK